MISDKITIEIYHQIVNLIYFLIRLNQICQNGSEWIKLDQIGSNWIKMDQNGSNWIKRHQKGSKWITHLFIKVVFILIFFVTALRFRSSFSRSRLWWRFNWNLKTHLYYTVKRLLVKILCTGINICKKINIKKVKTWSKLLPSKSSLS